MTCYFEVQENAKKLYGTRRQMLAVNINQDILKTYKLILNFLLDSLRHCKNLIEYFFNSAHGN